MIDSNFDADNSIETISADGHSGVTVTGDYSNQTLDFSETNLDGIESISGGAGHDTVIGSDGDDTILASTGNDNLHGGAGDDTFLYTQGDGADDFHGGEGNDTVKATGDDTEIVIDSNFDAENSIESISADGHSGVTVTGDYSNQTLDFSETNLDGIESISGGAGHDTVIGSDGDDTILASTGNDNLHGGAGDDTFLYTQGDGADDFHGGEGNDTVKATGDDTEIVIDSDFDADNSIETISAEGHSGVTVTGDYSNQTLDFSETNLDGIESISGGAGHDTVIGSDGDDTILASTGNDNLHGGAGDDTFLYTQGDGADDFHGGEGNDTVKATGDDTEIVIDSDFDADNSIETISADGHSGVTVTGDYSNQTLDFSETNLDGIESISGGAGHDTVIGSRGNDTLKGGSGTDTLELEGVRSEYHVTDNGDGTYTVEDLVSGRGGIDIVSEFENFRFADGTFDAVEVLNDTPTLDSEIADQTTDEDAAFSLDISSSFSDVDEGDTLSYSATLENGDPLPSWLSIDSTTGVLSGTPENGDVGTLSVTVTATDSTGATASDTFGIQVENTNDGPTVIQSNQAGLKASYFNLGSSPSQLSDIDFDATPDYIDTVENVDFFLGGGAVYEGGPSDNVAIKYEGNIQIDASGSWNFRVSGDDGFRLFVDGQEVVDLDGLHSHQSATGNIELTEGQHSVELIYFERGGDSSLRLEWQGPNDSSYSVISSESLSIPDSTINASEDSTFSLDTSSSFSDVDEGDTLTYSATLENGDPLPSWLSIDSTTGILSGTPENGDVGALSVTVTAVDSAGATASDSFGIQVENTNDGPTVSAIADQTTDEDAAFSLDISSNFSDVDEGDTLTYSATLENGAPLPSWLSIDSATGVLSGTPENGDVGALSVTVTATDSAGATASDTFGIQVENTNDVPTASAISDQSVDRENAFSLDVSSNFSDVDVGDSLTYSATLANGDPLPSWLSFNTSTGQFSGTPSQDDSGTISVKVVASDGTAIAEDTFDIQVNATAVQSGDGDANAISGDDYDDEISGGKGSDTIQGGAGNDTIYGDDSDANPTTATNFIINGSFEDVAGGNNHSWGISKSSVQGWTDANSTDFEMHVSGWEGMDAATDGDYFLDMAESPGRMDISQTVQGLTEDASYTLSFDVGDRSGDLSNSMQVYFGGELIATIDPQAQDTWESFSFEVTGGMGDGSNTLRFVETGGHDNVGISLDNVQLVDADNDTIDAGAGDDTITGGAGDDTIDGGAGTDTIVYSGAQADYDVINNGDGTFTITDNTSGRDGTDTVSNVEFIQFSDTTLSIEDAAASAPSLDTPIADAHTDEDAAFSVDTSASFSQTDGDAITYSATLADGSALPEWLSFNTSTGVLSGTPDNDDVGTISIKVIATDENGSTSDTFTLTVDNTNDVPTVTSAISDQSVTVTVDFNLDVSGNFGDVDTGDSLSFSATLSDGSALPDWLTIDSNTGLLSGTPGLADNGAINVKVTATDEAGATTTDTFAITVEEVPDPEAGTFLMSSGLVSIEAESYASKTDSGSDTWADYSNGSFSGGEGVYMASGDSENLLSASEAQSSSSELTYEVNFEAAGTYYVWVRADGTQDGGSSGNDDSLHIGLDGVVATDDGGLSVGDGGLEWGSNSVNGGRVAITVTEPGQHTLNIWQREDGIAIDKIVISNDANYDPSSLNSGTGPEESAQQAGIVDQGPALIAQWKFDESSGTTAEDASGTNDGTYKNGTSLGSDGVLTAGTSASFDGVDDYVEISPSSDFQLSEGSFVISFNPSEISGQQTLFSRDSMNYDAGGHIDAYIESDGTLTVRIQSDSASYHISSDPGAITAGTNNQMALSFGSEGLELFLNGTSVATNAYTGGISENNEPITIGASQQYSGDGIADSLRDFFQGTIDNFEIYDSQIDSTFAQSLYSQVEEPDQTYIGTSANETITTGSGDDYIEAGGGSDTINAGDGDDTINIGTNQNPYGTTIDGGDGWDTLDLEIGGYTLDFTSIDNANITNIEQINIDGGTSDTLRISAEDVLDMTDGNNRLFVDGDSSDSVEIESTYASQGTENIEGTNYNHYYDVNTDTHLYINTDITDTHTF
ncbi:putative Ig domain-containing protein [Pelagicoccus enzymogenes]|uniref:putative Ig domain-containing protein n=1 Tax=Pelagicoccus enzymogenes TaxID=2773457 RepID=UPI002966ABE0|nr:putative Ig domain-containing protein [Pelagicoccus enzymogenes]